METADTTSSHRRALITGATGFIGSRLVRHLSRAGWTVHVIVREQSKLDVIARDVVSDHVHRHDGTFTAILRAVTESRPDVVFHLASLFLSQHAPTDIPALVESNITFGTQLVEAMTATGCFRLVNTGTSWQHFRDADYSPVNLYAATKQAMDSILHFYVESTPLRVVSLQLFDTYGPGDPRPKLFSLLRKSAATGEPLAMSAGEQCIDLLYIDDVMDAYVAAAEQLSTQLDPAMQTFAVGSKQPIPLRKLVELWQEISGRKLNIQWGARAYRPREVMRPWGRGATLPGWYPRVGLEEGIRRMEGSANDG